MTGGCDHFFLVMASTSLLVSEGIFKDCASVNARVCSSHSTTPVFT